LSKTEPVNIVELADEQAPQTAAALRLIEDTFDSRDRQPVEELASEVAEKRLCLTSAQEFHLFAATGPDGEVLAAITGVYLDGVNAGFVTYLAVRPELRRKRIGQRLRVNLVERFRVDARLAGFDDLAWVLGEVRLSSPWLKRLVQRRGAVPFDLTYYHPGVRPPARPIHALYRQPVTDDREVLPAQLVRRLLFAVFRRGYRVRYPLLHPGFHTMMEELEGRSEVGMHPRFTAFRTPQQ
jgi:ribosomal protein S18 acetylase RimI-like enzyme